MREQSVFMQSIVKLSNLSKTFPGARALSHVDFELRAGAIHALVGENGAGKSTLINILNGIFPPDEGSISIDGQTVQLRHAQQAHRLGIVTVYQDADLFPDLSLAENIAFQQRSSTLDPEQALRSMQLSLSPSMPASELTAAQRQILSIGIAVSQKAKVLILDEPTSSLSQAEAQLLFEHLRRLRKEGVAILYVSHRLEDIFALADEVSVLRDGERVWSGPITETSTEHLIQQMVGRAVELTMRQPVHETGDVIFSCEHLSASDGSFSDVSLEVRAGEVLGMYGLIGAGRSEWAQTVFGLRSASEGEVKVHGTPSLGDSPHHMIEHGLIYLTEDRLRQGVCSELALRANAVISSLRRLSSFLWTPAHRESQTSQKVIEQLSVKAHSEHQSIGTLSGGNQQKVVLGRWLSCEPDVMILDEPTQGIDIGSKTEIHQLIHDLAEKGKAIILISSDLPEVLSQSDRVLVFREGRIVGEFQARDASAEDLATAAFTSGETESVTSEQSERTKPSRAWQWPVRELSLFAIVILFFLLMHLSTGEFLSPSGIRNRVTDASLLSLCALAATLVLLVGGLDISLGSLMALSAAVAGSYWEQGLAWPLAVILAMLIGAAGGWLTAALSLIGRVQPIVITLGTLVAQR